MAPEVSPDGRWLAFTRRIPDGTVSWKGHRYGPRNALWVRDLMSGRERVVLDPVEVDLTETFKFLRVLPGYSWTPDGSAIVISRGGQLTRVDVATGKCSGHSFQRRSEADHFRNGVRARPHFRLRLLHPLHPLARLLA